MDFLKFKETEISLEKLLDAREQRAATQKMLLAKYSSPLICFTMNIAGPVKISPIVARAFQYGLSELEKKLTGYHILYRSVSYEKSGPIAFFSISCHAQELKALCMSIENQNRIGRLFDMDVLLPSGQKLERDKERVCLVCGKAGRTCAAGRVHDVRTICATTGEIINSHFKNLDKATVGLAARNSLIKEVMTTPKPGLVDMNNTGSHRDMTPESFVKSANALRSYFEYCFETGISSAQSNAESTFAMLRLAGIEAENQMYKATNGVNTHKGIIYSLGIMTGALGRLWTPEQPFAPLDKLFRECAAVGKMPALSDFLNKQPITAGERLFFLNGSRGIRGEVAEGFSSVCNIALPVFKREMQRSTECGEIMELDGCCLTKKENDAGVITLLHLISNINDTSIYNRGGEHGMKYARDYAARLTEKEKIEEDDLLQMDRDFIDKNLSPGGSADLLAVTYFLDTLYWLSDG